MSVSFVGQVHASASSQKNRSEALIAEWESLAQKHRSLFASHLGPFALGERTFDFPRYVFRGPQTGSERARIGIFAAIHGDEPETAWGAFAFAQALIDNPSLAEGYDVYFYPLCNRWGYDAQSRYSSRGKDLNREFWQRSEEAEVLILEQELGAVRFDGLISLHTDDTSHGVYGFVSGTTLTRDLLRPALAAASAVIPLNQNETIDGFEASESMIFTGYSGILSAPEWQKPRPFEIVFETPHHYPRQDQIRAFRLALESMLSNFRTIQSFAQNI